MTGEGLRGVARRAVHAEITAVAEGLFREQGYDATTVDQIAARVGMSQRTFFRHVGTKDDLVLSGFMRQGERVLERVSERPTQENAWDALFAAFEVYTELDENPRHSARAKLMRSILESSPSLRAAYLDRMDLLQRQLTELLVKRGVGAGQPAEDRAVVRAIVGAAFAALYAATQDCDRTDRERSLASELSHIKDRLRPAALR